MVSTLMPVEAGMFSPKNRSFHKKNTPSIKNAKHASLSSSWLRSIMQMFDNCFVHSADGRAKEEEKGTYGVCLRSLPDRKWEVQWASGDIEVVSAGSLKEESKPTKESIEIVHLHNGLR